MEGVHLLSHLLQQRAGAELTRLGLALNLARQGEVGPMARVAWLLATAARLSTGQILFHDAAASHISQLLNLGEDLGALALQYFEGVRHGVLLEYRYSRILTLNPLFGQSPTNMSHTRSRRSRRPHIPAPDRARAGVERLGLSQGVSSLVPQNP